VRIAFIGLGGASRQLHLPAARSVDGLMLVGGADPSADARRAWSAAASAPAFDDIGRLLAETAPELVVVATPPAAHADHCVAALEAGAHVLCEKPFVETTAQADQVLKAAAVADRKVAVNHQYRFMPIFAALASQVGAAGVGRTVLAQATQLMDLAPWDEKVAWRAAMPHRTLFEGGVHIVDLLQQYMGRSPVRVGATLSSGLQRRPADALQLVNLDYDDGALAQITINRLTRTGTRYLDFRVDCEEATLRASYGGRAFVRVGWKRAEKPGVRVDVGPEGLAWLERGHGRRVLARNPRGVVGRATAGLWGATVTALRRGHEPPTTATMAAETLRVIEAAYRVADGAEVVELGAPQAATQR